MTIKKRHKPAYRGSTNAKMSDKERRETYNQIKFYIKERPMLSRNQLAQLVHRSPGTIATMYLKARREVL